MRKILSKISMGLVLTLVLFGANSVEAKAAPFTKAMVRYDRMKQNTSTSLMVIIVPATVGVESKIIVNFGSATLSAGQSATTGALPAGVTSLPGTLTAVGSGSSIAISGLTDLTVGTTYGFNLSVGVTTAAAGAATDTVTSYVGTTPLDSTTLTSRYITDDQVVITANVPPTFTFVLSGNTDAFATNLSSGSVSTTYGIGVSASTNAAKGWTGWIKSANAALSSVQTGESIGTSGTLNAAPETCVNATDCYVLDVGVTSGTGAGVLSADAEYAGNGTTTGGTFSTAYQPFASRTGKTNGDLVWLKAHATMIATKAAGSDYTDTWTIVGAGNF